MPLSALPQFDAREALKKQAVEARHVDARHVCGCPVPTANAADVPLLVDDQTEGFGEVIINAIAASAGVDKGAHTLGRQVGFSIRARRTAEADIHLQRRSQFSKKVGRKLAALALPKTRRGQTRAPE